MREEFFEFGIQLTGQRFIMYENKRRLVYLSDHIGNGKRLTGSRRSEKDLLFFPILYPLNEFADRLDLVTLRLIFRY